MVVLITAVFDCGAGTEPERLSAPASVPTQPVRIRMKSYIYLSVSTTRLPDSG